MTKDIVDEINEATQNALDEHKIVLRDKIALGVASFTYSVVADGSIAYTTVTNNTTTVINDRAVWGRRVNV